MNTPTLCLRCLKSLSTCYCSRVRSFRTATQIVLLQHPLERRKMIGTARMAHLCLENSLLLVGTEFDSDVRVNDLIADPTAHSVVLYPGPNAYALDSQIEGDRQTLCPAGKRLVVFVIDGTWTCARKMLQRSRNLSALPQICFHPDKKSEYKIRQQPKDYCWSSIEAVHRVLELLEPNVDASNLLMVFRSMVEQQLEFERTHKGKRSGLGP